MTQKNIELQKIYTMLDAGLNYVDIAKHFDCNKGTIFNMVKRDQQKKALLPIKKAREVLKNYELSEPPIDVFKIAKKEGFKILRQKLPQDISGMLEKTKTEKNIYVNSTHAINRQRFTVAHELGHHFLHRLDGEHKDTTTLFRKEDDSLEIDKEANKFASELLMPEKVLRTEIANEDANLTMDSVDNIASKFEVSVIALTYKLQNLGFALLSSTLLLANPFLFLGK
jgi:Zn-dependent peptidase ImmA (M78 family)